YAFEARGYSMWLAATAWYCLLLAVSRSNNRRTRIAALVGAAIAATIACTVHYFGIMGIALATVADLATVASPIRARFRRLIPAGIAMLALLLCIPLFLEQRRAYSVATWIPNQPLRQFYSSTRTLLVGWMLPT